MNKKYDMPLSSSTIESESGSENVIEINEEPKMISQEITSQWIHEILTQLQKSTPRYDIGSFRFFNLMDKDEQVNFIYFLQNNQQDDKDFFTLDMMYRFGKFHTSKPAQKEILKFFFQMYEHYKGLGEKTNFSRVNDNIEKSDAYLEYIEEIEIKFEKDKDDDSIIYLGIIGAVIVGLIIIKNNK